MLPQIVQGGVASDYIPSCVSGGVEVGLYDGYVISGGAAVLIYKKSVEWTYEISGDADNINDYNHENSLWCSTTDSGQNAYVTYTFNSPLSLPAGSTLHWEFGTPTYAQTIFCQIDINGTNVVSDSAQQGIEKSGTITYSSGTTLNTVHIRLSPQSNAYVVGGATVTITPKDGVPFKLTFLNSSEQ